MRPRGSPTVPIPVPKERGRRRPASTTRHSSLAPVLPIATINGCTRSTPRPAISGDLDRSPREPAPASQAACPRIPSRVHSARRRGPRYSRSKGSLVLTWYRMSGARPPVTRTEARNRVRRTCTRTPNFAPITPTGEVRRLRTAGVYANAILRRRRHAGAWRRSAASWRRRRRCARRRRPRRSRRHPGNGACARSVIPRRVPPLTRVRTSSPFNPLLRQPVPATRSGRRPE
jgi:hypothetical protein